MSQTKVQRTTLKEVCGQGSGTALFLSLSSEIFGKYVLFAEPLFSFRWGIPPRDENWCKHWPGAVEAEATPTGRHCSAKQRSKHKPQSPFMHPSFFPLQCYDNKLINVLFDYYIVFINGAHSKGKSESNCVYRWCEPVWCAAAE